MPPSLNDREEALFLRALELNVSERGAFLDQECADDPTLRARLEALIAAHEQPETLLPGKDAALQALLATASTGGPQDESVGQTIGRYRLLEKIGEGGCGMVYVAEQTDPVRRRVALKVIKLGMDTKAVVARFEAERQALAMMDHPNIAKVLDAGATDAGRPYFVMELVRGVRITDYCDQSQLGTRERLDLFIKVCQAIQHAHQKGIIHRDIKPSNILVTLHDGVPVPKVIDFGIAKGTEGRLTDATVYTQLHQFLGTPAYMSPEQTEMSSIDIDTRSDIYSLGVLLYELLTGRTPCDAQVLLASGVDAMRRIIREKEPVRPSTRLAMLKGEELTATAKRRATEPPRLIHMLRDDLDWIVIKCLEKDRARRYPTVNDLAADLTRHLNNEPVVARPPSAGYKIQKALQRNKVVFAASAAVVMALILALAISLSQGAKATRARKDAEASRRLAEERATAEEAAKANESREREAAQKAHARTAELLCELEIQRAGELFLADKPSSAVAYLGRVLREHPTNRVVADRLVSALIQLNVARPWIKLSNHAFLRFSPDGKWFITTQDSGVQLWDAQVGQPVGRLCKPGFTMVAGFSPDGRLLATSSWNDLFVYDVAKWVDPTVVSQPLGIRLEEAAVTVEFSPDGTQLIAAGRLQVRVWDSRTGQPVTPPITSLPAEGVFTAARFSRDARSILTTTQRGIQTWDPSTGRRVSAFSDDVRRPVFSGARFSPGSERWLTMSSHTVRTWDVASGSKLAEVALGSPVTHAEFSPDAQRILTVTGDRMVRIWDSSTGQVIGDALKHDARVLTAQFSPNGQWILTIAADAMGRLWNAFTGQMLIDGFPLVDPPHAQAQIPHPSSTQFSLDGRLLAVDFGNNSPAFWEVLMAPRASGTIAAETARDAMAEQNDERADPPPPWFPDMVEAVTGHRLSENRALETVSFAERLQFKSRLTAVTNADVYARVAKWLLADRSHRTVTPFSATTLPNYVSHLIQRDSFKGIQEALRLSPGDGQAMLQLAVHIADQNPLANPRRAGEAEYFSRRGLELTPNSPVTFRLRAHVLASINQIKDATLVNEQAVQQFSDDAELWNQKGAFLERAGSLDRAEASYSRALALAENEPAGSSERRAHYLLNRAGARARLGRAGEADSDRLAGLRLLQALPRDDSPQWCGNDPGRNLYSAATGLPDSFDLGQFNPNKDVGNLLSMRGVRYIVPLGSQSYDSLAVANRKVFVGTNNDHPRDPKHQGDRSILICLDEETGAFLWQLVIPKLLAGKVNDWESLGLLSTPAIEGDRVYLVTTRCEVLCLTTEGLARRNVGPFREEAAYIAGPGNPEIEPGPKDADIVWRYDMIGELGAFPHNGSRTHVLIVGDLLYVATCNGMDWTHVNVPSPFSPSLIALDKHTGRIVAEDDAAIGPRIFHGQWSSPSTGRVGSRQLVFYGGGDGYCYAFDAVPVPGGESRHLKKVWWADCNPPEYKTKNGRPIKYPHADGPSEILATPVFWKDRVYVAIGQDPEHGEGLGNLVCLDATQEGDITQSGMIWSYRKIQRSVSTAAITPEGLLFICDFSGFVHCVNAETGQPHWIHNMEAHIWGSNLVADGKVYVGDEDGDFVVFAADKDKRILSSVNLAAPMYSTPIVANGVVYFSTTSHLFAIENPSRGLAASIR